MNFRLNIKKIIRNLDLTIHSKVGSIVIFLLVSLAVSYFALSLSNVIKITIFYQKEMYVIWGENYYRGILTVLLISNGGYAFLITQVKWIAWRSIIYTWVLKNIAGVLGWVVDWWELQPIRAIRSRSNYLTLIECMIQLES